MTDRVTLFGDSISGNCYKIQLLCAELGIDHDWQEIDILAGETHSDEFLAMNANGKIPLLRLADGRVLAESNAILSYLAYGNALSGTDAFSRAKVLQWMFFEQYSHEPYVAASRFILRYLGKSHARYATLEEKRVPGYKALDVMELMLSGSDYLLQSGYSLADIALYAYTHVAHEGGFKLDAYPHLQGWLARVASRPRHVAMQSRQV